MRYALLAMIVLAGCGADGDPVRPELGSTMSIGSDGVSMSSSLLVRQGPVAIGLGF